MVIVGCDNKTYLVDTAFVGGRWELGPVLSSGGNLTFWHPNFTFKF
jgi:hypothetical protein